LIKGTIWGGQIYINYTKAYTHEMVERFFSVAKEECLFLFSIDKTAVDFLETLNVPAYKIASFEITDIL
jgi:pseudaminic acid synthase